MSSVAVAHAIPGRVRLRVPSLRGDAATAAMLTSRLREVPGVLDVGARALTGSLVLRYDAALLADPTALAALAAVVTGTLPEVDIEELAALVELTEPAMETAEAPGPQLPAGGRADWRLAVPAALAILGVAAFVGARTRPMPSWYTLLWYAFGTYTTLAGARRQS